MTLTVKGGPELRARLEALGSSGLRVDMMRDWQGKTSSRARSTAPRRTGKGQASVRAGFVSDVKATVVGAYWLIFVDRGTKQHDIKAKGVSGWGRGGHANTKALKFEWKGQTVFARKVHRRRMPRRPFITAAAQAALRDSDLMGHVVKAWNRKRAGRFTGMK